jgi:hypothetical protein
VALITAIAYDVERNLGAAYREIISRLRPEDHIVFLDHDAIFTTRTWFSQLLAAIERYPDAALFGAMTNRIGNKEQIPRGAPAGHDMVAHRAFGAELQKQHGTDAIDVTGKHLLSGVVLCLTHRYPPSMASTASTISCIATLAAWARSTCSAAFTSSTGTGLMALAIRGHRRLRAGEEQDNASQSARD